MSAFRLENLGAIQPNLEKCSIRHQTSFPGCALLNLFTITSVGRAFHKLLEIFQKVSRNFSKSCSKKKLKVAFRDESCSKVVRKNENFFGSDDKIWKLFNKSKISKYFCAILRRNQIC